MADYKYTKYFEDEVIRKRFYIKKKWCIETIESPKKIKQQEGNRFHLRKILFQIPSLKDSSDKCLS